MEHSFASDWVKFIPAMVLTFVRLSGIILFAPLFSSTALPLRTRAVFAGSVSYLVAPLVASLPSARPEIQFTAILGELAVGLLYGLTLAFLKEIMLFAGQIVGIQIGFSIVNLLDPTSSVQTTLLGDLFDLGSTLVIFAAGLDRVLLASIVRSFRAAPLGGFCVSPVTTQEIVRIAAGVFLAALELAAPILAATILIEVSIALLSKLSPQLPVMSLTVPIKVLVGLTLLTSVLALWPRFIEARFNELLNQAEQLVSEPTRNAIPVPTPGG
jgi:flagellar biosynthesis protein FliR